MEKKYVGAGQTAVMLSLFGVLYCVCFGSFTDVGAMLVNSVASVLAAGVLVIPLVILSLKEDGSLFERAARVKSVFRVIALPYAVYFICAGADFLKKYSYFVSERYFTEGGVILTAVLMGAVCLYISHAGAETVCRMSTVLLFMTAVTSVFYLWAGYRDIAEFDLGSIVPEKISVSDNCFNGLFSAAAAGSMCISVLCGGMGKNTRKGAYLGLVAMLIASAAVIFAAGTVMSDYINVSEYPAADAVIYVSRRMSFRPDGIFFALWTVSAAAVISLLGACSGHCVKTVFPKIKGEGLVSAAAVTAAAAAGVYFNSDICGVLYSQPWVNAVLLFAVPLVMLIICKTGKKTAKK